MRLFVIPFTIVLLTSFAWAQTPGVGFHPSKPERLARWQLQCAGLKYAKERILTEKKTHLRLVNTGRGLLSEFERELNHYYRTLEQALALSQMIEQSSNPSERVRIQADYNAVKKGLNYRRKQASAFERAYKGFLTEFGQAKTREHSLSLDYLSLKLRCDAPATLESRR